MRMGRAAGQIFLFYLLLDMLGRGDAISRLKSEDPWNFPQVLIAVFHQGGVRDGVELMMRWWSNSGVTWLFQ